MAGNIPGRAVLPAEIQGQDDGDGYAAAAPASPDVSKPVQPSALSTTAGAFNPAVPAKIVIETPQNPRAQR